MLLLIVRLLVLLGLFGGAVYAAVKVTWRLAREKFRHDVDKAAVNWELQSQQERGSTLVESFTLGWFNILLQHIWAPVLEKHVAKLAHEILSRVLVNMIRRNSHRTPYKFVQSCLVEELTLGLAPPSFQLCFAKFEPKASLLHFGVNLKFNSMGSRAVLRFKAAHKQLALQMRLEVTHLKLSGRLNLGFHLCKEAPGVRQLDVSFVEEPKLDLKITPLGSVWSEAAGLLAGIRSALQNAMNRRMVEPRRLPINISRIYHNNHVRKAGGAGGILRVTICSALAPAVTTDAPSGPAASTASQAQQPHKASLPPRDLYCELRYNKEVHRTPIVRTAGSPEWNWQIDLRLPAPLSAASSTEAIRLAVCSVRTIGEPVCLASGKVKLIDLELLPNQPASARTVSLAAPLQLHSGAPSHLAITLALLQFIPRPDSPPLNGPPTFVATQPSLPTSAPVAVPTPHRRNQSLSSLRPNLPTPKLPPAAIGTSSTAASSTPPQPPGIMSASLPSTTSNLHPPWTSLPSPVTLSVSHNNPSTSAPLPTAKSTPSPRSGMSRTSPPPAEPASSFGQAPWRSSSFNELVPPESPQAAAEAPSSVRHVSTHNRSASDGVVSLSNSLLQQRRLPDHSNNPDTQQLAVAEGLHVHVVHGGSFVTAAYDVPAPLEAVSRSPAPSACSHSDASAGDGDGGEGHAGGIAGAIVASTALVSHGMDTEEQGGPGFQSPDEELSSPGRRVPDPAAVPPTSTTPPLASAPPTGPRPPPRLAASMASSSPFQPTSPDGAVTPSTGFSPLPRTFSSSSFQSLAQVSKLMTLLDDERRLAVEAQAQCMHLQQLLQAFQRLRKAEGRRALVEGARFMAVISHPLSSPRTMPPIASQSAAPSSGAVSGSSSKQHARVYSVCYEATSQTLHATELGKDRSPAHDGATGSGSSSEVSLVLAMSAVVHVEASSRLFPQQQTAGGSWSGGLKGLFRRSGKGSIEAVTDSRCFSLQARDGTGWHLQLPVGGNGRSRDEWVGAVRDAVEEAGGVGDADRVNGGHW